MNKRRMQRQAYLLLLLTTLFWGGNAIAGKLAVGHISPMVLTRCAGRWLLAFMLAIGWRRFSADWSVIRQHWLLLSALGVFGFTVFNVALYSALTFTTAINVSIEQAGMPMLIFLLNFLFFRLKASWAQIVGLVMSIGGILLTASHGEPARLLALDLNFGDAIMLSACIVYSAYTVALRFKPAIHWQSLMIVLTGSAFVTAIPLTIAEFHLARHLAGRRRLADPALRRDLPIDTGADILYPRRRADRRQPRRPVHQSCADLRNVAVDHAARRGVPSLSRDCAGARLRRHMAGGARQAERRAGQSS